MLQQLWKDEGGAVVSPELCVVGVVLVLGLLAGLGALQMSLVSELADVSAAIKEMPLTPDLEPNEDHGFAPTSKSGGPLTASDLIGN